MAEDFSKYSDEELQQMLADEGPVKTAPIQPPRAPQQQRVPSPSPTEPTEDLSKYSNEELQRMLGEHSPTPTPQPQNPSSFLGQVGSETVSGFKGMGKGFISAFNPLSIGESIFTPAATQEEAIRQASEKGRDTEVALRTVAGSVPLFGPMAAGLYDTARAAPGIISEGTPEQFGQMLGGVLGGVAAPGIAGKAAEVMAPAIYRNALKFKNTIDPNVLAKQKQAVQTGIQEAVPASQKLGGGRISRLREQHGSEISNAVQRAEASGQTIDRSNVTNRLVDVLDEAYKTADQSLEKSTLKAEREMNRMAPPILKPTEALAMRTGKGQALESFYTGLKKGQPTPGKTPDWAKAQKALRKGLSDELKRIAPELNELDPKMGELKDLYKAIDESVSKGKEGALTRWLAIRPALTGAGYFAGGTGGAIVAPLLYEALRSPLVQSSLAIAINRGGKLAKVLPTVPPPPIKSVTPYNPFPSDMEYQD